MNSKIILSGYFQVIFLFKTSIYYKYKRLNNTELYEIKCQKHSSPPPPVVRPLASCYVVCVFYEGGVDASPLYCFYYFGIESEHNF